MRQYPLKEYLKMQDALRDALHPVKLRAWFLTHAETEVGERTSAGHCPLANYLTACKFEGVRVNGRHILIATPYSLDGCGVFNTFQPYKTFVELVDGGIDRMITGSQAAKYLDVALQVAQWAGDLASVAESIEAAPKAEPEVKPEPEYAFV